MTSCRIHPGNVERRERAIDARIERKLECGGVGALRESLGVVANALVRVNALQKPGLASDEPDFRGGPVVGTQRVAKRVRPGHRYREDERERGKRDARGQTDSLSHGDASKDRI